jgi:hypothetical protein
MSSPLDTNRARLEHIYTDYRNVRLSRDYYACRLAFFRRWNRFYEIILALGATGSVAAGWYIWKTSYGQPVWAVFSGLAAVLAIIKPILKIPEEVEKYSKLHTEYAVLTVVYQQLVDEIRESGGITPEMRERIAGASSHVKTLAPQDDPNPSEKLLRQCQMKIKKVVPGFKDWLPTNQMEVADDGNRQR